MNVSLSSVLFFALIIPYIMSVRLGWGDTPYWLFSIIFLLLVGNVFLDLHTKLKQYQSLKLTIAWGLILLVIGGSFLSAIIVRHQIAPVFQVHDIILQQEAAIRFFADGINPYATTYFGTPLEEFHYSDTKVNPALYHFVMQPFYLLFAIPFYGVSNILFGFFDGRIPLLFLFVSMLVLASILVRDPEKRLQFLALLAFNPAILSYTLEGRSDLFMYPFLFAGFFALWENKLLVSGILIALACAVKQSAWPLIPFYALYLFYKTKNIQKTVQALIPFLVTFSVIILPFFFWNMQAFLDSTVFYLSGSGQDKYPISGYGLGALLTQLGIIRDSHQAYPFTLWQIAICIPLFIILVRYLKKITTVKMMILLYGIFLFVFWYLSRYFNNSHLGYLTVVFITAYFWPENQELHKK